MSGLSNTQDGSSSGTDVSALALESGGNLASIKTNTDKIPALGQAVAGSSVPVVLPAAQITTLTPPAAITGYATETTLGTRLTESDFDTKTGSITETAPATDTASSGLNGRLQRIAQRLTSLITAIGSPFQAGGSIGNTTFASTQSGTWTVQPGNTANTTAWKVDGSAVTQPVSGTVSITANSAVNVAQMNGVATTMGNGVSGTGVQRVTLASDSTGTIAGVTTVTTLTGGGVAHDGVDSGNPVKIGGKAYTSNPTAVASGDRSDFITDKLGKQVVVNSIRDLKGQQKTTITSSTSETTIVTAVASTFLDLYGLIISNTSATACNVTIKDSTAGTTRAIIAVPAGDTRGFMLTESAAIPQATVNTNWTATCSASVASIEITALYVKNI